MRIPSELTKDPLFKLKAKSRVNMILQEDGSIRIEPTVETMRDKFARRGRKVGLDAEYDMTQAELHRMIQSVYRDKSASYRLRQSAKMARMFINWDYKLYKEWKKETGLSFDDVDKIMKMDFDAREMKKAELNLKGIPWSKLERVYHCYPRIKHWKENLEWDIADDHEGKSSAT